MRGQKLRGQICCVSSSERLDIQVCRSPADKRTKPGSSLAWTHVICAELQPMYVMVTISSTSPTSACSGYLVQTAAPSPSPPFFFSSPQSRLPVQCRLSYGVRTAPVYISISIRGHLKNPETLAVIYHCLDTRKHCTH